MRHVVVVEDDPVNARLFRMVLARRGGWKVTVTESAEELIALARSGEVDLVLMDVSLHNTLWEGRSVNGIDLSRMLKQDPATADIPVLLATAHAMRGDEERFLCESHADDYVSKPVLDHEAFVTQVRRWLERAA